MTDSVCSFTGDRDEALVTYLYDDGSDPVSRATFQAHLVTCVRCVDDLRALSGVRTQLARWSPPEPNFRESPSVVRSACGRFVQPESPTPNPRSSWRDTPAWAQVAAALLFLGVVGGGREPGRAFRRDGLSVRTGCAVARGGRGWIRRAPQDTRSSGAAPAAVAAPTGTASQASLSTGGDAQWRAELAALERRLTAQMHSPQAAAAPRAAADAELLRRVRALVDESEKRQQTELALRLAQVVRDITRSARRI